MKSTNKTKRGFTITELVIVIAVIAILAAILIPTFANVISAANESSDVQATKNMNTALYSEELVNGKPSNVAEVQEILAEAGYSDTLLPVSSNYHWYWNSYYNIIILIDDTDGWELIYPETDDADSASTKYISYCYDINTTVTGTQTVLLNVVSKGDTITVKTYESYDSSSNTGEIADNAGWEDIVTLSNVLGENFEGATITLESDITITKITDTETSNSILDFQGTFNGNGKTITIAEGGITPVYGEDGNGYLFDEMYESGKGQYDQYYAYGLFAAVTNGGTVKNLSVTYSDTTANATDPESKRTYFGGIVGFLGGDSTISDCSVSGAIVQYNRVGGIVGTGVAGTIENCKVTADITSCKSSADSDGSYSYAAGIVGIAIAEFSTAVNNIYVKNCVIGPDSGTMTISTDGYAGGITARITTGITEFNVTDTTIQNVTLSSSYITTITYNNEKVNLNGTSGIGAVCGGLYIENGLTGNVSVKNVKVSNHCFAENELEGKPYNTSIKFLYYTTDSTHENDTEKIYANKITRKGYSAKTLSSYGVSEYTIIVGLDNNTTSNNGEEYTALTMTEYTQYTAN